MRAAQPPLPVGRWLPPEAAVRRGRVGYDLTAAKLRLHTAIDED
jgi:hypothetical protein